MPAGAIYFPKAWNLLPQGVDGDGVEAFFKEQAHNEFFWQAVKSAMACQKGCARFGTCLQ